jgi:hypothetical protein
LSPERSAILGWLNYCQLAPLGRSTATPAMVEA